MDTKKYTFKGVIIALLKSLGYIATWFLISQLASFITQLALVLRYRGSSPEALEALYNSCITQVLLISNTLTLLIFMIFYRLRGKNLAVRCELISKPVNTYTRGILLGIFGQFAIQYLLSSLIVANLIPDSWLSALEQNNDSLTTAPVAINLITTVIIGPILEEVLCRGLMLGALKRAMPAWLAVGISSLIFGILHANPIGIIYATLFGVLLGFVAIKFKSITPAILCHIAFNATSFALSQGSGELGLIGSIMIISSVPITIILIIKTARYKELPPSDKGE